MANPSESSMKSIQKNLISASVRLLTKVTRGDLNLGEVWIYAAKFLNDGRLLTSDRNNRRLLIFNSDFGFIEQFPVAGTPRGLCLSTEGTTVHVVCGGNKVVTYTLQGGWQETSRFNTEQNTCALDRSGDTLICGTITHVLLYNKDGQKLSSIPLQQTRGRATAICTSVNGDMFYHTDGDKLVGRTLPDRKEIFRYSHPSLYYACGPSCDRDGNILVAAAHSIHMAGAHSNSIYQVSPDGQNGRILVDKLNSINYPSCVCCHPHRDVFVVTSYDEDTVMEIYEFC